MMQFQNVNLRTSLPPPLKSNLNLRIIKTCENKIQKECMKIKNVDKNYVLY